MRTHPGSIGLPFPGVDVRLDDDGDEVSAAKRHAVRDRRIQFDFGYTERRATAARHREDIATGGDIGTKITTLFTWRSQVGYVGVGGVEHFLLPKSSKRYSNIPRSKKPVIEFRREWGKRSRACGVEAGMTMRRRRVIAVLCVAAVEKKKPKRAELGVISRASPRASLETRDLVNAYWYQ